MLSVLTRLRFTVRTSDRKEQLHHAGVQIGSFVRVIAVSCPLRAGYGECPWSQSPNTALTSSARSSSVVLVPTSISRSLSRRASSASRSVNIRSRSSRFRSALSGLLVVSTKPTRSRRPPTLERSLSEVRGRKEPHRIARRAKERLYQMWQQPEAFSDDGHVAREVEQVIHYQVEALATKPVERVEHGFGSAVHPSLVRVHGNEPRQERTALG